jgi:DNA-binding response OmpR family regulator
MKTAGRKILCVDDDEDTCEILSLVLKEYDLVVAHTYQDALTKALSGSYDAILLDSQLPDGSGIDLCREIKESDSHIPIIFYSAHAYEHQIDAALQAGATTYLTKPLAPEAVGKAIEQVLS